MWWSKSNCWLSWRLVFSRSSAAGGLISARWWVDVIVKSHLFQCLRWQFWRVTVLTRMSGSVTARVKLQALVYNILPPAITITAYIVSQNLSANRLFTLLLLKWQQICNRQLRLYQAFIYNLPCYWRQHKCNQNRLNRDRTLFLFLFTWGRRTRKKVAPEHFRVGTSKIN